MQSVVWDKERQGTTTEKRKGGRKWETRRSKGRSQVEEKGEEPGEGKP